MGVKIKQNIIFDHDKNAQLLADLYLPSNKGEASPVIIFIHGGAFKLGSKDMYADWGRYVAEHGYAALAVNYRLAAPEAPTWPDALEDVKIALHWLIQHGSDYHMDANRIAVAGDSAGAYLAAMLAITSLRENLGRVRCFIGVYGIYDLYQWWEYTRKTRTDDPVGTFIGPSLLEKPEFLRKISPNYLWGQMVKEEKSVNLHSYIIWGTEDQIVEPVQSLEFIRVLEQTASTFEKLEVPHFGHYWFTILPQIPGGRIGDEPNRSVAPKILEFLQLHL